MFANYRVNCCAAICLLANIWLSAIPPAAAQEMADAASSRSVQPGADAGQLVPGDGYAVLVQRGPTQARYEGQLIMANDRWIVLRQRSEGRNESKVPVLGDLPYVKRFFRNVSIGIEVNDQWIPRAAATITSHAALGQTINTAAGDAPAIGDLCTLSIAEASQVVDHVGNLHDLSPGQVSITRDEYEARQRPIRGWSRLPVLGPLLTTQELVAHTIQEQYSLDDLLCFHVPVQRIDGDDDPGQSTIAAPQAK